MSATSHSAHDLIPVIIDAFKIYDQSSEDIKACTILWYAIFFLWGVVQNKTPPILMAFDSSVTGASCFACLQSSCIDQMLNHLSDINQANLQIMTDNITQTKVFSNISEILHSMRAESDRSRLQITDNDDDKAEAGWKAIPPLLQDMIIRASSSTDAAFPMKPNDSLL
jgi:hypothetical protein